MVTGNEFKSILKDRLTASGGSIKGNFFKQVAGDLAKKALGIAVTPAYQNQVRIFLVDDQEKLTLQIPVLPPEISIKWDRGIETVNILNLGEVEFTTGKKLQEFSFSSFFPLEYSPSYCRYADIPTPYEAYMMIDGWCAARGTFYVPEKPVRLMIVGTSLSINMPVLITSFEVKDKGGEPGDIYYSITCREWREIKVRTEAEQRVRNNRPNPRVKPKAVKKKPKPNERLREFLYKMAKQHYGNGRSWKAIMTANKDKLVGDWKKKAMDWVLK